MDNKINAKPPGDLPSEDAGPVIVDDRPPKPNLQTVMRLYVAVFLILMVSGLVMEGLHFEFRMIITQWVLILGPALWILYRYRLNRVTYIRLIPLQGSFIPVIILLSASFWLLNMVIAAGMVTGLAELGFEPVLVLEPPETFQRYLVYLFILSISAGICEEVLFRGTIMPALEGHGAVPAIVFSSFLFALFHTSFLNLVSAFMLGIVIAVIVIKTGSLWGGILYHMLNNFYAATYLYIVGRQDPAVELDPRGLPALLPLFILAAVGAHAGLRLLHHRSNSKALLKTQDGGWLPRGWCSWLLAVSVVLFLIMALLELALGFGWLGPGQI